MASRLSRADAALLLGFCVLATFLSLDLFDGAPPEEARRSLQATRGGGRGKRRNRGQNRRAVLETLPDAEPPEQIDEGPIYPWAEHLYPLTEPPQPENNGTVLFWHIPKSGGTTAKSIYECLDKTLANRAGALPQFGHDHDEELLAYRPWGQRGPAYVNVDTTSKAGILRAAELGLVPSGAADIIFTSDPAFAIEHLYDDEHKGRVMGLFRDPVERLVSKFYYLQVATWERTYRPQWKHVSVLEYARKKNRDNNHMVHKLAGKTMAQSVDEEDLQLAMRTVRERFVVGLMDQMEESVRRFNVVMGVDESVDENRACMDEFFGHGVEKKNSNSHPKLEEDSQEYKALAWRNALDIRLYEYIQELFEEQRELIASYITPPVAAQEELVA